MPKQAVIDLIARTLPAGLPHPGDDNRPPALIPLPGFRPTGMSEEQAEELIGQSARLVAEALAHLIETAGISLDLTKAEEDALRQQAADAPDGARVIYVHRGSRNTPPVLELTIGKNDHVVIPAAGIDAIKAGN